ncbi:MAG: hypothetical protein HY754_16255, partial [Nitrospirae bacterium]|nr:hypothetical protein [Nitrospirota bacterium]
MGEASRKNLFRNPIFHLFLITIVGLLAYSNTFNVPFQFDDSLYIIDNYNLRDLNNLWPPLESRWFGFLTFALNYHLGGLDVTGYHIVNLITHTFSAILVYFLVALTLRTPYFSFRNADFGIRNSENSTQHSAISYQDNIEDEKIRRWEDKNFSTSQLPNFQTSIALFSALLFVSHPIQTQAVTYIVQRFASLATFFYLLSLVMYIKFRIHDTKKMHDAGYTIHDKENHTSCIMNRESCIVSHASCIM